MKVGIVGHVDHGKSCLTETIIAGMKEKGIEVIVVDPKRAQEEGIHMTHAVVDELKSIREIDPFILQMQFTPPMTRRERRKLNRKNK